MATTKRRPPSLKFRLTDDFVVDLKRKTWFIDVEQYLWARFASRQFKNVTFRDWLMFLLEPMRDYIDIRIVYRSNKEAKHVSYAFAVGGLYDDHLDKYRKTPIKIIINRWKWPDYSTPGAKEWLANEIFKTVTHELNHLKQGRKKHFKFVEWHGDYYEDPDEVDSFALNAAQSLVARFGIREAKRRAAEFKTRDSHCSEIRNYATINNVRVQERFLKRVSKYISVYEEYENNHGKNQLNSYRLHKTRARTKRTIKQAKNG